VRALAAHLRTSVRVQSSVNEVMVTLVMLALLMEYWYPEKHSVGTFGNSTVGFHDTTPSSIFN